MKKTVRHRAVQFSDITENMWNRNEIQTKNTASAVASVGLSTSEGIEVREKTASIKKYIQSTVRLTRNNWQYLTKVLWVR